MKYKYWSFFVSPKLYNNWCREISRTSTSDLLLCWWRSHHWILCRPRETLFSNMPRWSHKRGAKSVVSRHVAYVHPSSLIPADSQVSMSSEIELFVSNHKSPNPGLNYIPCTLSKLISEGMQHLDQSYALSGAEHGLYKSHSSTRESCSSFTFILQDWQTPSLPSQIWHMCTNS